MTVSTLRIGELAARTGVTVRALRYYEEQHLLEAARAPGGQRRYPDSAVDRVHLIRRLFAAGLSSRAIAAICPLTDEADTAPERLATLLAERDRIDREARQLAEARDRLDTVIAEIHHARDDAGHPVPAVGGSF